LNLPAQGVFTHMVGQTGNSSARYLKTLASSAKRDMLVRSASKHINPTFVNVPASPSTHEEDSSTDGVSHTRLLINLKDQGAAAAAVAAAAADRQGGARLARGNAQKKPNIQKYL